MKGSRSPPALRRREVMDAAERRRRRSGSERPRQATARLVHSVSPPWADVDAAQDRGGGRGLIAAVTSVPSRSRGGSAARRHGARRSGRGRPNRPADALDEAEHRMPDGQGAERRWRSATCWSWVSGWSRKNTTFHFSSAALIWSTTAASSGCVRSMPEISAPISPGQRMHADVAGLGIRRRVLRRARVLMAVSIGWRDRSRGCGGSVAGLDEIARDDAVGLVLPGDDVVEARGPDTGRC